MHIFNALSANGLGSWGKSKGNPNHDEDGKFASGGGTSGGGGASSSWEDDGKKPEAKKPEPKSAPIPAGDTPKRKIDLDDETSDVKKDRPATAPEHRSTADSQEARAASLEKTAKEYRARAKAHRSSASKIRSGAMAKQGTFGGALGALGGVAVSIATKGKIKAKHAGTLGGALGAYAGAHRAYQNNQGCPCGGKGVCTCKLTRNQLSNITINFNGRLRREILNGRSYMVAPLTLIVPGVLNGSKGPLYYPPSEISKDPMAWNNVPITLDHPKNLVGEPVSGRDPLIIRNFGMGYVFNAHIRNGKLVAEGWFDVDKTARVSPEIFTRLKAGRPIELSTGLFTDNEPKRGVYNGRDFHFIARNYRPDHLAVFSDKVGACSLEDGCGVLVNYNKNHDEDGKFASSTGGSATPSRGKKIKTAVKESAKAAAKEGAISTAEIVGGGVAGAAAVGGIDATLGGVRAYKKVNKAVDRLDKAMGGTGKGMAGLRKWGIAKDVPKAIKSKGIRGAAIGAGLGTFAVPIASKAIRFYKGMNPEGKPRYVSDPKHLKAAAKGAIGGVVGAAATVGAQAFVAKKLGVKFTPSQISSSLKSTSKKYAALGAGFQYGKSYLQNYNKNHGEDGKFTSGTGGGGASGQVSLAKATPARSPENVHGNTFTNKTRSIKSRVAGGIAGAAIGTAVGHVAGRGIAKFSERLISRKLGIPEILIEKSLEHVPKQYAYLGGALGAGVGSVSDVRPTHEDTRSLPRRALDTVKSGFTGGVTGAALGTGVGYIAGMALGPKAATKKVIGQTILKGAGIGSKVGTDIGLISGFMGDASTKKKIDWDKRIADRNRKYSPEHLQEQIKQARVIHDKINAPDPTSKYSPEHLEEQKRLAMGVYKRINKKPTGNAIDPRMPRQQARARDGKFGTGGGAAGRAIRKNKAVAFKARKQALHGTTPKLPAKIRSVMTRPTAKAPRAGAKPAGAPPATGAVKRPPIAETAAKVRADYAAKSKGMKTPAQKRTEIHAKFQEAQGQAVKEHSYKASVTKSPTMKAYHERKVAESDEQVAANEGRWITTKGGKHIFIDGEGNITKGNIGQKKESTASKIGKGVAGAAVGAGGALAGEAVGAGVGTAIGAGLGSLAGGAGAIPGAAIGHFVGGTFGAIAGGMGASHIARKVGGESAGKGADIGGIAGTLGGGLIAKAGSKVAAKVGGKIAAKKAAGRSAYRTAVKSRVEGYRGKVGGLSAKAGKHTSRANTKSVKLYSKKGSRGEVSTEQVAQAKFNRVERSIDGPKQVPNAVQKIGSASTKTNAPNFRAGPSAKSVPTVKSMRRAGQTGGAAPEAVKQANGRSAYMQGIRAVKTQKLRAKRGKFGYADKLSVGMAGLSAAGEIGS